MLTKLEPDVLKSRSHLEVMCIDGTKDLEKAGCEDVGWAHLTEDIYQWKDLRSTVMKPGVS
jgi:hypothetical protein